VEKRIAIVFSDVIREIYKMRGGKVVNSNNPGANQRKSARNRNYTLAVKV
jgi:hypothetical protein